METDRRQENTMVNWRFRDAVTFQGVVPALCLRICPNGIVGIRGTGEPK